MKVRFSFEMTFRREPQTQPEEPQFEHRDNDGTMVVHVDQPRYIGFARQEETPDREDRGDWGGTEIKTPEKLQRMQDGGKR